MSKKREKKGVVAGTVEFRNAIEPGSWYLHLVSEPTEEKKGRSRGQILSSGAPSSGVRSRPDRSLKLKRVKRIPRIRFF